MYIIVMMLVSFLGAIVFLVASYVGFFLPVELNVSQQPAMVLIYQEKMGPYHLAVEKLQEVEQWAKSQNIDCEKTFGTYFDNPDRVEHERLRAHVGCWVPGTTSQELRDKYSQKWPKAFQTKEQEAVPALELIFHGSPGIGPLKVYPEADEWMAANNHVLAGPITEVYKVHADQSVTTVYYFPIKEKTETQ